MGAVPYTLHPWQCYMSNVCHTANQLQGHSQSQCSGKAAARAARTFNKRLNRAASVPDEGRGAPPYSSRAFSRVYRGLIVVHRADGASKRLLNPCKSALRGNESPQDRMLEVHRLMKTRALCMCCCTSHHGGAQAGGKTVLAPTATNQCTLFLRACIGVTGERTWMLPVCDILRLWSMLVTEPGLRQSPADRSSMQIARLLSAGTRLAAATASADTVIVCKTSPMY